MAAIIAYILNPLVTKLENRKIPRHYAIMIIYAFFIMAFVSVVIYILPELIDNIKELINTLPEIFASYQRAFNNLLMSIRSSRWSEDIKNTIFHEIETGSAILERMLVSGLKKSLSMCIDGISMFFDFLMAMIIAYYLMKDADFFREGFLSLFPRKWRNGIITTAREINAVVSNFIKGQLLTALIVGCLEAIGLLIIKVRYPVVLGFVGGIANIIPYFGPFIGAIPAVAVALLQSPAKVIWTIVVFTLIQQIDNNFISPKIIEGRLGLHPVTTILVVLVGGEFFGIFGMLVSVPAAAILKIILKRTIKAIV